MIAAGPEGREESGGEEQASARLGERGEERVEARGAQAELLEHLGAEELDEDYVRDPPA